MVLNHEQLPTFQGIVAGETAISEQKLGRRVHKIQLEVGDADGTVAYSRDGNGNIVDALITQIRVKLNGKAQRTMSLGELAEINGVNGSQYAAVTTGTPGDPGYRTFVTIFFAEPWRKVPSERLLGAWNIAGVDSFQIECDIKEGVNSPILKGTYFYDALTGSIGLISKWIRRSYEAVGSTRDYNVDREPADDFIQAIHAFPTTDGKFINRYKLTANGIDVRNLIFASENQAGLISDDMFPDVSGIPRLDIVFDATDRLDDALPLAVRGVKIPDLNLYVEYDSSASGNLPTIAERLGRPI